MARSNANKAIAVGEGERIWKTYGISAPDQLVLEDVAFARGVIVTDGSLERMEARLVRQGGRGLIRVRTGLPEAGRRRFAIAHELGHWELHKDVSQLFACTEDDMLASYKSSPLEAEANYFAAGLLMPEFLFEPRLGHGFSFSALSAIAEIFGTSLTATAIRFVELSDDYVAIVASTDGRIKWWRGSSCFEEQFWISPGSRLSSNTAAASLVDATRPSTSTGLEEVDADAWAERGAEAGLESFMEESRYLARYNQILTLLRLP